MKRLVIFTFLLALVVLVTGTREASAQAVSSFGIGPKLGFYVDGSKLMLGAVGEFPLTPEITAEPGLELIPGDNQTTIVLDLNGRYSFIVRGETFAPFALAGLALVRTSATVFNETITDTDFWLNIGGGLTFNTRSTVQPWGGLKITLLGASSDVVLQGGVNFYL